MSNNQKGQSLIEVVIALLITGVVIGALATATTVSVRNAQYSQNQTQATKIAQDGLEKIRTIRNRDGVVNFITGNPARNVGKFSGLWSVNMTAACGGPCYFTLNSSNLSLTANQNANFFDSTDNPTLKRQIYIEDSASTYTTLKTVTVKVRWVDAAGQHESYMQTVISKL